MKSFLEIASESEDIRLAYSAYANGRTIPMQDFRLLLVNMCVQPYLEQLSANPQLWENPRDFRKKPRYGGQLPPHRESEDIWVRHQHYEDLGDYDTAEGFASLQKSAVSEWYPESLVLPAAKDMAQQVCGFLGSVQLGGHYIIKVPPGKKVYPHIDSSWHSAYYNKYMVVLKTQPGVIFGWDRSGILVPSTGDMWNFENDTTHWVINDSPEDLIIATFSVRTFDMDRLQSQTISQGG